MTYLRTHRQKALMVTTLVFAFALVATSAFAALTFTATQVSSDGALTLASTGAFTVPTITLANGETIGNATDGQITFTGKGVFNGTRVSAITGNEYWLQANGDITGTGDASHNAKTFGLGLSMTRQAGTNTAYADFDDAMIKGTITNKATANAASYILSGIDYSVRNRGGGNAGQIRGAYITAQNYESASLTNMYGVQINIAQDATNTGNTVGLFIQDQSQSANGTTYGMLLDGTYAEAREYGIVIKSTAGSWGYGLDMNGATIGTADIRLNGGSTIKDTAGVVTIGAATTNFGGSLMIPSGVGLANSACTSQPGRIYLATSTLEAMTADKVYVCNAAGTAWLLMN